MRNLCESGETYAKLGETARNRAKLTKLATLRETGAKLAKPAQNRRETCAKLMRNLRETCAKTSAKSREMTLHPHHAGG